MKTWLWALVLLLACVSGAVSGGLVAMLTEEDGVTTVNAPSLSPVEDRPELPNIPQVIDEVRASVVSIEVTTIVQFGPRSSTVESAGTGFVVSAEGLIATNAHVVSGARTMTVTFSDGTSLPATLVGSDSSADLAVVRVARTGLVPLAVGDSGRMRVGDMVMAIGNALALEGGPTVSLGIISAKDRVITSEDGGQLSHLIQTDAAINEGDSGGPLVNAKGEVIGINTISASQAQNIGFAIAINEAMTVINGLIAGS